MCGHNRDRDIGRDRGRDRRRVIGRREGRSRSRSKGGRGFLVSWTVSISKRRHFETLFVVLIIMFDLICCSLRQKRSLRCTLRVRTR